MLLKLQERGVQRPLVDGELVGSVFARCAWLSRIHEAAPSPWSVFTTMKSKRAVEEVRLVGGHTVGLYS